MDNVRINLNIPLNDKNEKDILHIKNQLKKGKFPTILNPYKDEVDILVKSYNLLISDYKKENLVLPSVSEFRRLLRDIKDVKSENLIFLLDQYIEEKRNDFRNSPSSIKDFISFKNSILDYQIENECILTLNFINRDFVRNYFYFLQKKREPNKGYKTKGNLDGKTIRKRLDVLKSFAKWHSLKTGEGKYYSDILSILKESTFNTSKLSKDVKKVSLSLEQISFLQKLELLAGTPYCKVRDMFVFVCQTGLRFSDLITLNEKHIEKINGNHYIYRQAKKTKGKFYRVEISDYLLGILNKYKFKMKLMTNQKANLYLKELLSKYDLFNTTTNYINPETGSDYLLYEVISFHQGRRSFITNLLDNGYSVVEVMERTDHTKVSTLEKYVSPKGYGERNILNLWST